MPFFQFGNFYNFNKYFDVGNLKAHIMKLQNYIFFAALILANSVFAQPVLIEDNIVEVSGIILTRNEQNGMQYVPFATVAVENSNRGTYANWEGMFSIVVKKGESLSFTAIGFGQFSINIPIDYEGLYYSAVIELESKDVNLAEVIIFPWPNRDNFRAEFLAMQPSEAMRLEDIAEGNLNRRKMFEMSKNMGMDATENAMYYLQKQASSYSYMGQGLPMPILSPVAWSQFFRQWQNNKKKKKNDD